MIHTQQEVNKFSTWEGFSHDDRSNLLAKVFPRRLAPDFCLPDTWWSCAIYIAGTAVIKIIVLISLQTDYKGVRRIMGYNAMHTYHRIKSSVFRCLYLYLNHNQGFGSGLILTGSGSRSNLSRQTGSGSRHLCLENFPSIKMIFKKKLLPFFIFWRSLCFLLINNF